MIPTIVTSVLMPFFFDMTNQVIIDVTGGGVEDIPPKGVNTRVVLNLANKREFLDTDFGGTLRFLRFIVKRSDEFELGTDQHDGVSWKETCVALKAFVTCDDVGGQHSKKCRDFVERSDTSVITDVASFLIEKMYGKLFKPGDGEKEIKKTVYQIFTEFDKGKVVNSPRSDCPALVTKLKDLITIVEQTWILNGFTSDVPKSAGVRIMVAAIKAYPADSDTILAL